MKARRHQVFAIYISFMLAACNIPLPASQSPAAVSTSAAQTVQAVLTPASPLATQTLSSTSLDTQAPQATPLASDTPSSGTACEERAEIKTWTRDGTTYDSKEVDKLLAPNKPFAMSWVVQNTGTCVWNDTYNFVFTSGDRVTTTDSFPVMPHGYTVSPGQSLTINIQMAAPSAAGNYSSSFSLENAAGDDVLNVGVLTNVGAASSGSLAAPGNLRYTYSCSPGVVDIGLTWSDRADGEDGYRIYRDGTKLIDLPAGSTSYDDVLTGPGTYQYTIAAFDSNGESPAKVVVKTTNCL